MFYNDLRIYKKIVAGCGMCPSLLEHLGVFVCEKTGSEYEGTQAYIDNCPLFFARIDDGINTAVTQDEKAMLTASFTADFEQKNGE